MDAFQLVGLPAEQFSTLFELSDSELAARSMRRATASSRPGFPCRVSLADADIGDELLLLPFVHQPGASPYHSSGPIFVRKGAVQPFIAPGAIPDYVATRLISVRAYNATHFMIDAQVCAGAETAAVIRRMFSTREVDYIHLHNANRGCFSCAVRRV